MRRLLAALFGLCLVILPAAAQAPLPPPEPHRGLVSRMPFEVAPHLLPQTRVPVALTVTRFDDPPTIVCDPSDGVSLREAIVNCSASGQPVIYLPSGTYALSTTIVAMGVSFSLIGQDPLTTTIQSSGVRYFDITLNDTTSITFANLTLANSTSGLAGNALRINGGGHVNLDNVRVQGNINSVRGSVRFDVESNMQMSASITNSEFSGNASNNGGAIAFTNELGNGAGVLHISNSRFVGNSATSLGGALLFSTLSGTTTATITNTLFQANTANSGGGAVSIEDNATSNVSFIDSTIRANTATFGGGVFLESDLGTLTIQNSQFLGNTASNGSGGAVSAESAKSVFISGSVFDSNSAPNGVAGALNFDMDVGSISMTDTTISNNSAQDVGGLYAFLVDTFTGNTLRFVGNSAQVEIGGALLAASNFTSLTDTTFTLNHAGQAVGGLSTTRATLRNVRLEDNAAPIAPDCRFDALSGISTSFGGVSITDMSGCTGTFTAAQGDLLDNLLVNGGFETAGATQKQAAGWTLKNGTGDNRACNKPNKTPVTPYGNCAFQFKGGAGEKATLVQNVDLTGLTFSPGQILTLSAMGDGSAVASKLKITVIAAYSDQPKNKSSFTISGNHPALTAQSQILTLTSANVSKLTVQIKHSSPGGKVLLDRVFLVR